MNTVLKYDRVVLIKELDDKVKKVGDTFEIANILDNSFLLRDAKTKVAVGVINFEDFDKHFVHEERFKGWTNWTQFTGFNGQNDCFYRTNRKDVEVKFVTDNVRAKSFLHRDDDFNLSFGIQMAYLRCLNKTMLKKAEEYKEELKKINVEMIDNERIIEKMISSLEK